MRLPHACKDERFDRAIHRSLVAEGHAVSMREVRRALGEGRILIDGRRRAPGERARGGESVELERFTARADAVLSADSNLLHRLEVVFEDPHILGLSKPSGIPTAPLRPDEHGTLLGAAVARCPAIGSAGPPLEGGLVHRLDTATSGIVLFAKDEKTREALRTDFGDGAIEKRYLALVWDPDAAIEDGAVLEGAIAPGSTKDRVRVLRGDAGTGVRAQPARTVVRVLRRFPGGFLWIEAVSRTGRRHQIRAHLASAGAPIVGDAIYGGAFTPRSAPIERLALHASSVLLRDGRLLSAPLPSDLERALADLESQGR